MQFLNIRFPSFSYVDVISQSWWNDWIKAYWSFYEHKKSDRFMSCQSNLNAQKTSRKQMNKCLKLHTTSLLQNAVWGPTWEGVRERGEVGGTWGDYVGNWSKIPFLGFFGQLPHIDLLKITTYWPPHDERVRSSFAESCKKLSHY